MPSIYSFKFSDTNNDELIVISTEGIQILQMKRLTSWSLYLVIWGREVGVAIAANQYRGELIASIVNGEFDGYIKRALDQNRELSRVDFIL